MGTICTSTHTPRRPTPARSSARRTTSAHSSRGVQAFRCAGSSARPLGRGATRTGSLAPRVARLLQCRHHTPAHPRHRLLQCRLHCRLRHMSIAGTRSVGVRAVVQTMGKTSALGAGKPIASGHHSRCIVATIRRIGAKYSMNPGTLVTTLCSRTRVSIDVSRRLLQCRLRCRQG